MARSGDKGYDFLFSNEDYFDENGEGYKYSDGSGYYNGVDGSSGYIYSDGSGYFHGADGSEGQKYEDGSGYYITAEGERKTVFASEDSDESDEDNFLADLFAIGVAGFTAAAGIRAAEKARREAEERRRRETEERERKAKQQIRKARRTAVFKRHWKKVLGLTVLFVVIGVSSFVVYESKLLIPVGISSAEALISEPAEVRDAFRKAGFENIRIIEQENLDVEELEIEGTVQKIKVFGDDEFEATDLFPNNAYIKILVNSAKIISAPIDSGDAKGKNYQEVMAMFDEAGFREIYAIADADMMLGWIHENGEVSEVQINDTNNFESGDSYRIDAKVEIHYHTYKE